MIETEDEMRECGQCYVCCVIGAVPEIGKPPHTVCSYLSCNNDCSIYDKPERPSVCSGFRCGWINDHGEEKDRPDKNGVLMSVNFVNGGTWTIAVELEEGAVEGRGRDIIIAMARKIKLPVVIVKFGSVPPHDTGDQVAVRDDLKQRARKMIGKEISRLATDIGIYELVGA